MSIAPFQFLLLLFRKGIQTTHADLANSMHFCVKYVRIGATPRHSVRADAQREQKKSYTYVQGVYTASECSSCEAIIIIVGGLKTFAC